MTVAGSVGRTPTAVFTGATEVPVTAETKTVAVARSVSPATTPVTVKRPEFA